MKNKYILFIAISILVQIACKKTIQKSGQYPNGAKKYEITYEVHSQDSVKIKETKWYTDGQKEYEGSFKDNKRNGTWTYWYANGKIWTTCEYLNGQKHGVTEIFHQNGIRKMKGQYKYNQMTGSWSFFDQNEKLVTKKNYP